MKIYRISEVIIFVFPVFLILSCHEDTLPNLKTIEVSSITQNTATIEGIIYKDGGAPVISRGVCWSTEIDPDVNDSISIDGAGTGSFLSNLTDLQPATTYYVRAYATNSLGTAYGDTLSFETLFPPIIFNPDLTYGTVVDIDGNEYKTIIIGTQTWMAENLKTTRYRNGDLIETASVGDTPKYQCAYNGQERYVPVYGRLYTWYAATDNRSVCPTGWHVPSMDEWILLGEYFGKWNLRTMPGGPDHTTCTIAGGKMKETATTHWGIPNISATNESGFTALPGGVLSFKGSPPSDNQFIGIGGFGAWWSSSSWSTIHANMFSVSSNYETLNRGTTYFMRSGMSVRCVQDN